MSVLRSGLTLGLGLIISLGPQNIFLIRQGIKKEYAYVAALICALCDMLLIILSTLSISKLIMAYPIARILLISLGVLFLIAYGAKSIYLGIKQLKNPQHFEVHQASPRISLLRLLITAISFSLLNPHAIIDTMVMIGGVVSQYPEEERLLFVVGVITASFLWFTGVATISSYASKFLKNGKAWGVLEIVSGFIMLGFSLTLINS